MIKKTIKALVIGMLGTPQALVLTLITPWWGEVGRSYPIKGWPLPYRSLGVGDSQIIWEFSFFGLLVDWIFWIVVMLMTHYWLVKRWGKKEILWTVFIGVFVSLSCWMVLKMNKDFNIVGSQQFRMVKVIEPKGIDDLSFELRNDREGNQHNNEPVLTNEFYASVVQNFPRSKFEELLNTEGLAMVTEFPNNVFLVRLTDKAKYPDTLAESDYIKNKYEVVDIVKPLYECKYDGVWLSGSDESGRQTQQKQVDDCSSLPNKSSKYYLRDGSVQAVDRFHVYIEVFDQIVEIKSRDLTGYIEMLTSGLRLNDLKMVEYNLSMIDQEGRSNRAVIKVFSPDKNMVYTFDNISGKYLVSTSRSEVSENLIDVKRIVNSSDLVYAATRKRGNCPNKLEVNYTSNDTPTNNNKTMVSCPGVWVEMVGAER